MNGKVTVKYKICLSSRDVFMSHVVLLNLTLKSGVSEGQRWLLREQHKLSHLEERRADNNVAITLAFPCSSSE